MMYDAMLTVHGGFGFAGLLASIGAILTRLVALPHSLHVWSGRLFTIGMVGVGLTGLVIAYVQSSLFFYSLAFFVLYLAAMGWRYAKVRGGLDSPVEKMLAVVSLTAFVAMAGLGGYLVSAGEGVGILLAVFGTIGLLHAIVDVRGAFGKAVTGRDRIAAHLSRMLGGTIAALTAFLLIQFESSSPLVWLGPAAVLTPVMLLWKFLVKRNRGLHRNAVPGEMKV
ncbi:MAG: hypothetical protein WA954_05875 [Parerythrobacter sp.]